MTLEEVLLAVRSRASGLSRPESAQQALATLTGLAVLPGTEAAVVRKMLAGFLSDTGITFTESELSALGPLPIGAFDRLLEELLSERYSEQDLRSLLRPLFIRIAN